MTAEAAPRASGVAIYTDGAYGYAMAVPVGMTLRHAFSRGHMDDGAWKSFAPADSHGISRLALVLDGSNGITAAELRVGVGKDDDALTHCLDVPEGVAVPPSDKVVLDGVSFVHFRAADAAMSHYVNVDSYRTVHAGRCYAIDLRISGTRPEVYDPPATPPFDGAAARQALLAALGGLHFLPQSGAPPGTVSAQR